MRAVIAPVAAAPRAAARRRIFSAVPQSAMLHQRRLRFFVWSRNSQRQRAQPVAIALPAVGRDLSVNAVALHWVLTAYVLSFGGLLLLGGRLADVLGRGRLMALGLALFGAASLAGYDAAFLAAAGATALAVPVSLALLARARRDGPCRGR